jgi:hypothetical protein
MHSRRINARNGKKTNHIILHLKHLYGSLEQKEETAGTEVVKDSILASHHRKRYFSVVEEQMPIRKKSILG